MTDYLLLSSYYIIIIFLLSLTINCEQAKARTMLCCPLVLWRTPNVAHIPTRSSHPIYSYEK